MTVNFDPRAWNLLVGLTVVSGCGCGRIAANSTDSIIGDDSTDTMNDGETTTATGPAPDLDPGPECVEQSDCGYSEYCYNGVCEPYYSDDGRPSYECDSPYDDSCGYMRLCQEHYCVDVSQPPGCGNIPVQMTPTLDLSEPVLALAFVDVDNDGAQELIAATQTQLHVYESGSPMPVSHARGLESATVDAIDGGTFDAMPGDDVIVLHDYQLDMHGSDGLGNLSPAMPIPIANPSARLLLAGAFDIEPMTDLLVSGTSSTDLIHGNGDQVPLSDIPANSASVRELGLPASGIVLQGGPKLYFFDIDGLPLGEHMQLGNADFATTHIELLGVPLVVGSSSFPGPWTLFEMHGPVPPSPMGHWGLNDEITQMRAGDLDGLDNTDELAMLSPLEGVWLLVGGECLRFVEFLPGQDPGEGMVFGDHDGDGDDELAVRRGTHGIVIIDVE